MKKQTKRTVKNKAIAIIIILELLICIQYILLGSNKVYASTNENSNDSTSQNDPNKGEYIRLTDLEWRKESGSSYRSIIKNKAENGTKLSVKIEGAYYEFDYGIWAHATSNVYYDISQYSEKYHYLTMYVGINRTSNAGNGVKFWIYTRDDENFVTSGSESWELKNETESLPGQNAVFVKVDIRGAKYLRLQAYDNGSNGNDHSVYIDPMLITDNYEELNNYGDISKYDQRIKDYQNKDLSDPQYEKLVLQRKLISNIGGYALKRFTDESPENQATIDWLMNDVENLRYYVLGGTPTGGYYNSLKVLTRLLKEYKSDFDIQEPISDLAISALEKRHLNYPVTKGNLYKRMAITLSLTHSAQVALWMQPSIPANQSDAVNRYKIYKYLYNEGMFKATDNVDITSWFETYTIEEMRYVMNTLIDDEEIIWLNEYVQTRIDAQPNNVWSLLTPHPYMAYVWPTYSRADYYSADNKAYFNELFQTKTKDSNDPTKTITKGLFDYEITRAELMENGKYKLTRAGEELGEGSMPIYKLWMNFRNKFGTGAVCGGISKSGHCIRGVNGIASAVIGQPGHAALIYYNRNGNAQGYWGIDNDVSGWTLSEKGERLPLGWGNDRSYRGTYNIPYIVLAQEAINDMPSLTKAEELLMTVDVYKDDKKKQEEIYKEAIRTQSINLDAWVGLINLYKADNTKTEEQYYNLVKDMMEALKCFPYTVRDLSNTVKSKFTSDEYKFKYSILETRILTEAKNYPNEGSTVLQPSITRTLANYLLGNTDTRLATFSFDGVDAGKIKLGTRFEGNGVRWDYSLDGKNHWTEVNSTADDHTHQLTKREIESITAENDIYVHIVGASYDAENIYKIDITESAGLPLNLFASDLENRMIAVNLSTEWRYSQNDSWTPYSKASPDLTGNKTIQLRQGATGTSLASKEPVTFTFTEDNQPDTRKYIPVSHLNLQSVSTQATSNGGAAINALDANFNTRYHSAWNGTDTERFIVIKLDKPVYLSAVEFVPAGGGNGRIVKGEILGSMTGEEGTWVSLTDNNANPWSWPTQANDNVAAKTLTKSFEIPEEKRQDKVQFVKIIAHQTNGNWFAARAFNFFQDVTKEPHPTAGIAYSTTEPTSGTVIARLINPSTDITITNNDGKDSYVFTKNGEFRFEFQDKRGNTGSALAKVTWIDKDGPTADVNYDLDDDKKLHVIFDNISEDVYLLDQNNNKINYIEVNENKKVTHITYLDNQGNAYKVLDKDGEGNTTKITYKNTTGNVSNVATYITTLENGIVAKEEYFDAEGNPVTIEQEEQKEALRTLQQTTRSNPLEYALDTSGEYEFKLLDKAENLLYKSIKVDYIDNNAKILASDITYNITKLTNTDVIATLNPYIINTSGDKEGNVTITSNGGNTHTFTEDGRFTFQYKEAIDEDNLEVKSHEAIVSWIDKVKPTAEIAYSTKEATSGEVIATLTNASEEIEIVNNGGNDTYTFTDNGDFTFKFIDKAGNEGTATAHVTWIDETLPIATITYNTTELTNQDVIATITFDKENVTVTGGNTYTFTENGNYTFEYITEQGDRGTKTAYVTWIDKNVPIATITYSTTNPTNQDVIAMLSFNKNNVSIKGGNGHRFTENGKYTFEFEDLAGNKGTIEANVTWIDKKVPTATITYSTTNPTNKDVIATISFDKQNVTVTGGNTHTFSENGEYTFEFVDNAGNRGNAKAVVNWIDKKVPTATITYSTTNPTNKDVIATISFDEQNVTVTGGNTHTFSENGEYTFEFVDSAGNRGIAKAVVTWIDKNIKDEDKIVLESTKYKIEDKFISMIRPGIDDNTVTTVKEFKENVTTNQKLQFLDKNGKELGDNDRVVTGMKLKVGEKLEYTLIVKGDIDGDGKITINDLARLKLHCIEQELLQGEELKAANVDTDNIITINDLAVIKLVLIGLEEI